MSNSIATGTIQDPAVPMIRLPATFRSRRIQTFADKNTGLESHYDIMDVEGCGCVRHISTYYAIGRRLEICVDGAQYAQVDMPQKPFFGIMHDLTPYVVDTPAYTVIPNYETPNMPGNPNYNLYLPIPFSKSCRIHAEVSIRYLIFPHGRQIALPDVRTCKGINPGERATINHLAKRQVYRRRIGLAFRYRLRRFQQYVVKHKICALHMYSIGFVSIQVN